jgi:hypothetical protein
MIIELRHSKSLCVDYKTIKGNNPILKHTAIILLAICHLPLQSAAQVRLQWKVTPAQPLFYNVVLDLTNTTGFSLGDADIPAAVINQEAAQNFFDLFGKKPCYAILRNKSNKLVDVKISQRLEDSGMDEKTLEAYKNQLGLEENVLLRGMVFADGGISTYFIENQQKSLLSAGFELPSKAISKGDTWGIDFSCLDLDGVIITDTISRKTLVKAEELEFIEGDTLVTISYDLSEFMQGKRQLTKDQFKEMGFAVKYIGLGKFSVQQGRWLEYNAVFTLETSGLMNGKMKGIFALKPVEEIPEAYKKF